MTDHSDAIIVRWEPARGPPRRLRFEPRSDGRYRRVTEEWNGCAWRATGQEIVTDVAVDIPEVLA